MRRWLLATGLILLGAGLRAESLTLATYNLANYNLTDRQIEGAFLAAYPKPEREKTALRRVLHEIDADVVALQEIGGDDFLRELQRDLRREGLVYTEAEVLVAADSQRMVGVLSRRPLTHVGRHTELDFKYFTGREQVKRGMLEVQFETQAGTVSLFVVHLKSRLTERKDDPGASMRRGREATAARGRVLTLFPEPENGVFIIAGDFNEGPMHRPVRAFSRIGEREISQLIPAADSRGETWTHRYRRNDEYSRVDFVMVSAPLIPWVRGGAGHIPDSPAVLQASDHRPVVVTFDIPASPDSSE